jgi:hypothetical protein
MKKSPLRKTSKKRAKELRAYAKLRKTMLVNAFCEFSSDHTPCGSRAEELHHIRGRIGHLLNDRNNILLVCREHHRFIHDHGKQARALGLLK